MIRRPPRSTRTDTLFPYTTLFRSSPVTRELQSMSRWDRHFDGNGAGEPGRSAPPLPLRMAALGVQHCRGDSAAPVRCARLRSEEHTSELQSLMRISYAVFCLKKKIVNNET